MLSTLLMASKRANSDRLRFKAGSGAANTVRHNNAEAAIINTHEFFISSEPLIVGHGLVVFYLVIRTCVTGRFQQKPSPRLNMLPVDFS